MKNTWSQKRIPTLLGLGVLVVGLVAGILFLGQGFGSFSPRATPQTTPKNIQVTNVTDSGFTVSFITDESTTSFIKYGTEPTTLNLQVSDDRDQISGTVTPYTTHYISARELKANTTYYFTIGTGSNAKFDNNGQPYSVKTAIKSGNPGAALTIYGTVNNPTGPASGSIVYAEIEGVTKLSSLVKDSGSWSIPLSSAHTADGASYAKPDSTAPVVLTVQGPQENLTASSTTTVAQAQPAPPFALGDGNLATNENQTSDAAAGDQTDSSQATENIVVSPSPDNSTATENQPSSLSSLTDVNDAAIQSPAPSEAPAVTVVDLQAEQTQVVQTDQPTITGSVPANVKVTIEIHSETQITSQVQADDTGTFSLDLAELAKTLEPGVHTVTISYTDPQTGKVVTQQKTFTVEPKTTTQQLALAQTSSSTQPFGSSNPYAITDPTPSPTPTPSTATSSTDIDGRTTMPTDPNDLPTSGSTETTIALVGFGILLIAAGSWSFMLSRQSTNTIEMLNNRNDEESL